VYDLKREEVRFKVKDPDEFDMEKLKEAFAKQNFKDAKLKSRPGT
jgi:hypothetical protein